MARITATTKVLIFKVQGVGHFPLDMLRYDACWPYGTNDALAIPYDAQKGSPRTIELASHSLPTEARWRSFGWRVL
ncbi:MAG: hypothetical protein MN733_03410 [Nitrososphaera sp.]|nr:hypothetical protein [Nitrososphaera sp.]